MKINIKLDSRSIKTAIRNVKKYQKRFDEQCKQFVEKMIDMGMDVAKVNVGAGHGDASSDASFECIVSSSVGGKRVVGKLIISSVPYVDDQGRSFYPHLAWEFGAGIYYNNGNSNPKAAELGFGVGTFPEQTHAIYPGYWWYKGDDGNAHLSLGTQATMPMYKASVEMMQKADQVAREVFKSGR